MSRKTRLSCFGGMARATRGSRTRPKIRTGAGPVGLTSRPRPTLILRRSNLDEDQDHPLDMGFNRRGTLQEKFYWRPVAPTLQCHKCLPQNNLWNEELLGTNQRLSSHTSRYAVVTRPFATR